MDQELQDKIASGQLADMQQQADATGAGRTLPYVHTPDGSILPCENDVMATILKVWRHIKNPTVNRCVLNNPAKFHSDPIWNDGALDFFKERRSDAVTVTLSPKTKNNKMSSDMRSVPDPITVKSWYFWNKKDWIYTMT